MSCWANLWRSVRFGLFFVPAYTKPLTRMLLNDDPDFFIYFTLIMLFTEVLPYISITGLHIVWKRNRRASRLYENTNTDSSQERLSMAILIERMNSESDGLISR